MKYLKQAVWLLAIALLAAFTYTNTTITGMVVDNSGQPVAHAIVQEKGTPNSRSAGGKGGFSITGKRTGAVLVFTAVGFGQKEIPVKGRRQVKVVLEPLVQTLNEVVVVGYGTTRKQLATG